MAWTRISFWFSFAGLEEKKDEDEEEREELNPMDEPVESR